jgi:TetR/AcrR family tetracycline transcriptional repressor
VALTRQQVVRTAVALLDEVGLEGLTLRRLATELGVQAPTLYWHVRDKRELLDLMAEAIVVDLAPHRPASPRHGQPWWEWLAEGSRTMYRALLSHRDAALVVAGNRPTEDAWPRIEEMVGTLVTVGFPPAEAVRSILALGAYVGGCAVEQQAARARPELAPERQAAVDAARAALQDSGRYPYLAAATAEFDAAGPDAEFEHGLELMLAGMRARLALLVRAPAGSS